MYTFISNSCALYVSKTYLCVSNFDLPCLILFSNCLFVIMLSLCFLNNNGQKFTIFFVIFLYEEYFLFLLIVYNVLFCLQDILIPLVIKNYQFIISYFYDRET